MDEITLLNPEFEAYAIHNILRPAPPLSDPSILTAKNISKNERENLITNFLKEDEKLLTNEVILGDSHEYRYIDIYINPNNP